MSLRAALLYQPGATRAIGRNGLTAGKVTGIAAVAAMQERPLEDADGANRSNAPRLAFTNQYCEPWARPQENFYLGVPKEKVRAMSREMQILLGYELRRPGDIMGQVGGYHPIKTLDPDFVLPVLR